MFVSFKKLIQSTVLIVINQLAYLKYLQIKKQLLNKKQKQKFLEKKQQSFKMLWKRSINGQRLIKQLKTFQTKFYQKAITTETLMDTTSLVQLEIKVPVVHATLFHSLKWLNLD